MKDVKSLHSCIVTSGFLGDDFAESLIEGAGRFQSSGMLLRARSARSENFRYIPRFPEKTRRKSASVQFSVFRRRHSAPNRPTNARGMGLKSSLELSQLSLLSK